VRVRVPAAEQAVCACTISGTCAGYLCRAFAVRGAVSLPRRSNNLAFNLSFSQHTALLTAWPTPAGAAKHAAALAKLRTLQLIQDHVSLVEGAGGGTSTVALAPHFRAAVAAAAARGRPPAAEGGAAPGQVLAAASAATQACAALVHAQWSGLLLYLAGEADRPPPPPSGPAPTALEKAAATSTTPHLDGRALLATGRFIGPSGSATPGGLTLLLSTTGGQLWALLRARCDGLPESSLAALVSLLLQLAARGGRGDPIRAVPEAAMMAGADAIAAAARAAADAAALGLAWPFQGGGEIWLAPTILAEALRGKGDAANAAADAGTATTATPSTSSPDGFIVVETNFRLYAYTADPARLAALALFASVERCLPNLAVCRLTRASVLGALDRGVPAEAVIAFLRDHASPHVVHRSPVVPETVMDQIRLWGAGRSKLRVAPATLYDGFANDAEFQAALGAARHVGGLMWLQEGKPGAPGRLVADAGAHDAVRAAIKAARGG